MIKCNNDLLTPKVRVRVRANPKKRKTIQQIQLAWIHSKTRKMPFRLEKLCWYGGEENLHGHNWRSISIEG